MEARRSDDPATPYDGVIDPQHEYCADDGDDEAVKIETRDTGLTELVEQEAADYRTDDTEQDVDEHPLSGVVDHLAADEAGHEAEHDPGE
jgi:hypothetical protein